MPSKKIVCLGGGSLYFPHAIADIVSQSDLAGSEIVLYDIDADKLRFMSQVARRLAREAGTKCKISATCDLVTAIDDADFAISSIGGSGAEVSPDVYKSSFHNADMQIAAKYGIHQIIGDTGGPAAMMMAFRSIPVYLNICRQMEKRCPKVIFFNHSNPMAVLMRAIHKYTSINAIGICHGVQGGIHRTAQLLNLDPEDLQCSWVGTNHYYWLTRILHKGKDIYPLLLKKIRTPPPPPENALAYQLSAIYNHVILYAQDDHIIEFYPYLTQIKSHAELPDHLRQAAISHGYDDSKTT
ncbi:MAG: hypothetical protein FWD53_08615, partial [Phycisphaerales bacterium]|nr:hypothetical protein [Phycisphaerales bacterium]